MPARAAISAATAPGQPSVQLLALLTFVSGCAALVFQVAWMRELRLVFGATTAATAAVLAIFMAGLGVGSAVLGKRADRVANPLRMYGMLEVAIALSAAVTPWLIDAITWIYIGLGGQESLGLAGASAVRVALAALVMAIPTFLMGGTLPAAVRSVTRASDGHRRALGVLYGSNTLGAVFGAAAATFFALEHLGTRATLWMGCALGLSAGALAMARARRLAPLVSVDEQLVSTSVAAGSEREIESSQRPRLIYLTAAVLGFTFFALELVWYRMLGPILGGTAFTFGLILCIALFGIGLGGIAYNILFRTLKPSWAALAITCGCEALFTIVPYVIGDRLALIAAWRSQAATSFSGIVLGWTQVAAIVVLPAALVSGIQFPLLIALLGHGRTAVSKHVGTTYAWNTFGAIAGSLVAGFGGLPLLTAPGMWLAIALLLATLSVCLLVGAPRVGRGAALFVTGLAVVTCISIFARGPTAAWRHGGIGAGRSFVPTSSEPNRLQNWLNVQRYSMSWEADGIESSVAIAKQNGLAFIVNGKSDGSAVNDAATQVGVSILGAALHDDPKTALVIGLGTGESAGWLAQMREIERVDVVELEPAIDAMALRCSALNWDVLHHPRVRRIYNDGREFVFTTTNKYDLIISEPSNPYRAGVASLYTIEFYQAVRKRLNPGGIFVQWLQAYEISNDTFTSVIATIGSQFKHVEVWQTMAADLQLVCSETPIEHTAEELRARIGSGAVRDALFKTWSVDDLEGFLSHFVVGPQWAREIANVPFLPLNTDDRTLLEYGFGKTVGRSTPFSIDLVRAQITDPAGLRPTLGGGGVDWNQVEFGRHLFNALYGGPLLAVGSEPQASQDFVAALAHFRAGDYQAAVNAWPAANRNPSDDIQRLVLAKCYARLGRAECLELIAAEQERHPTEAAALRADYFVQTKQWSEASRAFGELFDQLRHSPWVVPGIVEDSIARTIDVAEADHDAALEIYNGLARPFAAFTLDYIRLLARVMVADQLTPERVVEALSPLEPNVPWTSDVLEARAKAYVAVDHPLAGRARRDWDQYQSQRTAR